jgi:hypothetical protein
MTNIRNRVYTSSQNVFKGQFYSLVFAFECLIQAFGNFDSVFKFKYSRIQVHEEENEETLCDKLIGRSETIEKQNFDLLIDLAELSKPFDVSKKLLATLNRECSRRCTNCNNHTRFSCENILSYPEILVVSIEYYGECGGEYNVQGQFSFEKVIKLGDEMYELCAIIYGNGSHFTAILEQEQCLYEYDDSIQSGKVRKHIGVSKFFPIVKFSDECFRRASMLFYRHKVFSMMERRAENIERNNKFLDMLNLPQIISDRKSTKRNIINNSDVGSLK